MPIRSGAGLAVRVYPEWGKVGKILQLCKCTFPCGLLPSYNPDAKRHTRAVPSPSTQRRRAPREVSRSSPGGKLPEAVSPPLQAGAEALDRTLPYRAAPRHAPEDEEGEATHGRRAHSDGRRLLQGDRYPPFAYALCHVRPLGRSLRSLQATADGASGCHSSAVCTKAALFSASAARRARTCSRAVRNRGARLPRLENCGRGSRCGGGFLEALRAIPAGGRAGYGDLSGHDRCLRVQRDSLGCSPRHAFMDVRHKHGAPSSWWCELRVGGVGMRESVASAESAPPGLKIRTIASHVSDALSPYFSLDDVLTDFS
jgi:hypothetical protein